MNKIICKWLPKLIELDDYNGDWEKYNNSLYQLFKTDLLEKRITFKNKPIMFRINPKENGFEHAFIHLTCKNITKDYTNVNNRTIDFRRSERLLWIRQIIEHYPCLENCINCNKIWYYEEVYKSNIRINLVLIDQRYKVILEERKNYILLITGYYLDYNKNIIKEIKKHQQYLQQKTPLI